MRCSSAFSSTSLDFVGSGNSKWSQGESVWARRLFICDNEARPLIMCFGATRLKWLPLPPRPARPSNAFSPPCIGMLGQTPVLHVHQGDGSGWRWGLVNSLSLYFTKCLGFCQKLATNLVPFFLLLVEFWQHCCYLRSDHSGFIRWPTCSHLRWYWLLTWNFYSPLVLNFYMKQSLVEYQNNCLFFSREAS